MKIKQYISRQQNNISFDGGLNRKTLKEIKNINVDLVSHSLFRDNILSDFRGNKTVA